MKKSVYIVGGIVVALAALAYHGYQKANEFIDRLTVRVKGFSIPKIQSGIATVPLTLEVINPTDLSLSLKNLSVNISIKQANGSYKPVGNTSIGFTTIPAMSRVPVSTQPQLNLNNINPFEGKSVKDIFSDIFSSKPLVTFLIEYNGTYTDSITGGIPFSGREEKQITLPINV